MLDITALFKLSYGIYLITAHDGEQKAGCLVNTVFQLTAEPVRVGVSVAKENQTHDVIAKSGTMAVAVLSTESDSKIMGPFGYRSGRDVNKFAQIEWKPDTQGDPIPQEHIVASLSCKVVDQVDMQTHTFFVCEVLGAQNELPETPMTYQYYRDVKKGQSSKYAPTYVDPKKAAHN